MKTQNVHQQAIGLPVELAQPARRALAGVGIQSLQQLTRFSEGEIKKLHGIGPNALSQLHRALAEHNLSFDRQE